MKIPTNISYPALSPSNAFANFLRHSLRLISLVSVLGSGTVLAEDTPTLYKVETMQGCYFFSIHAPEYWQSVNWTGGCKNGFANGNGVLTYVLTRYDRHTFANAGAYLNGYRKGLWMQDNQTAHDFNFLMYDGFKMSYLRNLRMDGQPQNLEGALSELNSISNNHPDDPQFAYVLSAVKIYYQDSQRFYSGNFGTPQQNTSLSSNAKNEQMDDAKVVGSKVVNPQFAREQAAKKQAEEQRQRQEEQRQRQADAAAAAERERLAKEKEARDLEGYKKLMEALIKLQSATR